METLQLFALNFGLAFILYPFLIRFLNHRNHQQSVSDYALESFKEKKKTPILGGTLFILLPVLSVLLFPSLRNDSKVWMIVVAYLGYGLLGFADDVKIIIERNNKGLSASFKFLIQILLAIIFYILFKQILSTVITIPLINYSFDLAWAYVVLVLVMLAGASNGVNLTDGMDGLAGGTSLIAFAAFAILAYVQHESSVLLLILAMMGSLTAYLFYNRHPAQIFMGDTGALALGAGLAAIALVLKQELTFILIGGVFVYETLCVMLQISWVKLFKKRLFRYTPIHYSFTLAGWNERHVVYFFWGLGILCMVLGLWVSLT